MSTIKNLTSYSYAARTLVRLGHFQTTAEALLYIRDMVTELGLYHTYNGIAWYMVSADFANMLDILND